MKLAVTTTHTLSTDTVFDLPDGTTWDDVTSYYVKWGTLFLFFKDGNAVEVQTNDASFDSVDFKYPDSTTVRPVDADDCPDFDAEPLAEKVL